MKARLGFVSNSSSSSFIVAIRPGQDKAVVTLTISSAEELEGWAKGQSWLDAESLGKCLKAIKGGKVVLVGGFSSDGGNDLSRLMYERGLVEREMPEGSEIISCEGP